jgi:mono/diheme cytochrome c family protein
MKAFAVVAAIAFTVLAMTSRADEKGADPVAAGRQVFDQNCAPCHGPGIGFPPFAALPGTGALAIKYRGKIPALLTERTDLTPEVVAYFVRHGVSDMPPYRKTEINDAQLAALGAYLSRNNPGVVTRKGNRAGKSH